MNQRKKTMKTWKVCVETGPMNFYYLETTSRTRKSAVNKVRKQVLEEQRTTGIPSHFMICESAVIECISEKQEENLFDIESNKMISQSSKQASGKNFSN